MKQNIKVHYNNELTKENKINVLDMSHLCKDPEIEEIKKNMKQKKQYKITFSFIIYLLAMLWVFHTCLFYYNLIF